MRKRLPKMSDIWQDDRGYFLVLKEEPLTDFDKRNGYVCCITVLDLNDGLITNGWTVSDLMIREMHFVA